MTARDVGAPNQQNGADGGDNSRKSEGLYTTYRMFGDDPFILTDDPACKFAARDYARERVRTLAEGK